MSEGVSQGPATERDPRYKSEIVKFPGAPLLYVRLESGPDSADAGY